MKRGRWIAALVIAVAITAAAIGAVYVLGIGRGPAAAWPLTGLAAPSEAATRVRVISVKIENAPAARPQDGIAAADVVYETLTEGGITRFNVLYHSRAAERVGPVRSARLSDLHVVRQYRAVFARAGANSSVEQRIRAEGIEDIDALRDPGAFERSAERRAPHNLYTGIPRLREIAREKGFPAEEDPPVLRFGDAPAGGSEIAEFGLPFSQASLVRWTWDAKAGGWRREINAEAQVDDGSRQPYSFENVVVLFVTTSETGRPGTLDIDLAGSGEALVFRDGRRYDGRWSAGEDSPPRLVTDTGEALPLAKGKTWFEVVPADFQLAE